MTTGNQLQDEAPTGIICCDSCLFYERDNNCRTCSKFIDCSQTYLQYYVKFPFFIIDNFMSKDKLSHSAFIVFLYICRKADFRIGSNHFGRCWLTLGQISETTGIRVSNMRKYLNELQSINMINWSYHRKKDEQGFKTIHEFKVTHLTLLKDIAATGSKRLRKSNEQNAADFKKRYTETHKEQRQAKIRAKENEKPRKLVK
jgi:hypothetical protein